MMNINEGIISLTKAESRALKCPREVAIGDLACWEVIDDLQGQQKRNENMIADQYTGLGIAAQEKYIKQRLNTVANVAEQVLLYEIEEEYDIPHAPLQRPEDL